MRIGHISTNTQYNISNKIGKKNSNINISQTNPVSFGDAAKNIKRAGLAGTAALVGVGLAGCNAIQTNVPPSSSTIIENSTESQTADDIANAIDAMESLGLINNKYVINLQPQK